MNAHQLPHHCMIKRYGILCGMDTRKHLPRTVLARIYFIDRQIASEKFPNVYDLAKEYEVGTATIYRDIEYMRYSLKAPIEYSAKKRGWYYAKKTFRLPARFADAGDMLALGMAKNLLAIYKNTPLYESAKKLLENITAPLCGGDETDAAEKEWYERRIVVPPPASYLVDKELWEALCAGLRENRAIVFDYQAEWNKPGQNLTVYPWQLLFDSGAWYLYAWSKKRNATRLYALSRMNAVTLTDERFTLPKEYDYCKKNTGSYFGVFSGEKSYHFRVVFYGNFVLWARERLWAEDQKIEEIADGVIVDFTSTQYGKVIEWVLSKGSYAEPLEPKKLVEEWREHITKMRQKC